MKRIINWRSLAALIVVAFSASLARADPLVKPGDRLFFLGDGAVGQRGCTTLVMDYFALRHPDASYSFRTLGFENLWHADKFQFSRGSIDADITPAKPALLIFGFGQRETSDPNLDARHTKLLLDQYASMVERIRLAGISILILSPAALPGPAAQPTMDMALQQGVLAARDKVPYIDLLAASQAADAAMKDDNVTTASRDGSGLSPAGQVVAALAIIKALDAEDPASSLVIDAAKSTAAPLKCEVKDLAVTDAEIAFTRTDDSLPLGLPPGIAKVARDIPGLSDLNRYGLTVTGLKAGSYALTVDGKKVGTFTAETLAAGVDLSLLPGPWQTLAASVHTKSVAQECLYDMRCKKIAEVIVPAGAEPERTALVARMDALVDQAEATRIAIPAADRTWKWSLQRTAGQ